MNQSHRARLDVFSGCYDRDEPPKGYRWADDIGREALPSLMRKVLDVAGRRPDDSAVVAVGLGLIGFEGADQQHGRKRKDRKA